MANDFWSAIGEFFGVKPSTSSAPARQLNSSPARTQGSSTLERQAPGQYASLPGFSGGGGGGGRYALSRSASAATADDSQDNPSDFIQKGLEQNKKAAEQVQQVTKDQNKQDFWGNLLQGVIGLGNEFANSPGQYMPSSAAAGGPAAPAIALQEVSNDLTNDTKGKIAKADQANKREDYLDSFGARILNVKQLSEDEWAALSPEQQKGVLANFAIYQAAQADKKLGPNEKRDEGYDQSVKDMFGEEGGSDTYAPNTLRVLSELGYKDTNSDLDLFLDGRGIATDEDVKRVTANTPEKTGSASILQRLENSDTFKGTALNENLANGARLLDALRDTQTLSDDTLNLVGGGSAASQLPQDRLADLDNVMQGMMNKSVWERVQQDPKLGQSLQSDITAATEGLDPALVRRYFAERYRDYNGDPNFMNFDEFTTNWLQERG